MLTPVDIENKEFKKAMRGYDVYEVESFIKDIVGDYERLYRENANMKEKIEMLTSSLSNYRAMEETMQNAMIVAQSTAEDIKKTAYDKAGAIVKEAEIKAKESIAAAEKSVEELNVSYRNLKNEVSGFKNRIKAIIMTYDKLLDDFPKNIEEKATKTEDEKPKEPEITETAKEKQAFEASKISHETKTEAKEAEPHDIYEELKKVAKRETKPEDMLPENPHLKKQNQILDEILTRKPQAEQPQKSDKAEGEGVREVVINLSKDGKEKNTYYDVFNDPNL